MLVTVPIPLQRCTLGPIIAHRSVLIVSLGHPYCPLLGDACSFLVSVPLLNVRHTSLPLSVSQVPSVSLSTLTSPQKRQHGRHLSFSLGHTVPLHASRLVGDHWEFMGHFPQSRGGSHISRTFATSYHVEFADHPGTPPGISPLGIMSPTINLTWGVFRVTESC